MTPRNTNPPSLATFYCLCSEMNYEEMLEKQKENPLTFPHFLEKHTNCVKGCGSCIDNLNTYLMETGHLIE